MSTQHFLTKRSTEVNWPSGGVQLDFSGFERLEFVSLRFVGRLFFVMKMSFKFDTAKKLFRVLFSSEFFCLFGQWHEIQAFSENLGVMTKRLRAVEGSCTKVRWEVK